MNKTIKRMWLKALRSGKYKQIQQQLGNNQGHCCLGVLCEVMKLPKSESPNGFIYSGLQKTLPSEATCKAKIPQKRLEQLILRNDEMNWNFTKIATWIEKYL